MKSPAGLDVILRRAIAALLAAVAFTAASYRNQNPDLFWHLATARQILATGEIPDAEFASFTAAGRPWTDYEWGWQLVVHAVVQAGGFPLLGFLNALWIAAAVMILYRAIRDAGGDEVLAALLGILAIVGGRARFDVRPEGVTFLLLPLVVYLVWRWRNGSDRALWWIPALFVPWANLHPGFVFGIGYLGLAALGEAGDVLIAGRSALHRSRALALTALASAAATLAGPNFHRPWLLVWESIFHIRGTVLRNEEWQPTPLPWNHPESAPFWALAALTLVVLFLNRRRTDMVDVLTCGAFAFLGAFSVRNAALFPFVAAPAFARALRTLQPVPLADAPGGGRRLLLGTVLAVQLAFLAAMPLRAGRYAPGYGIDERRFPVSAADWTERNGPLGNLYNDYPFGGYLEWRFFPERRVFIDGKHIPYAALLRDLERALDGGYPAFSRFLASHGIEWAVVRYPPSLQGVVYPDGRRDYRAWSATYLPRSDWALVHWDDVAMVFVRRHGPNAGIANRQEYRALNPDDSAHAFAEIRAGRGKAAAVLGDLERRLREDPGVQRARTLRDALLEIAPGTRPASPGAEEGDGEGTPDPAAPGAPVEEPPIPAPESRPPR